MKEDLDLALFLTLLIKHLVVYLFTFLSRLGYLFPNKMAQRACSNQQLQQNVEC